MKISITKNKKYPINEDFGLGDVFKVDEDCFMLIVNEGTKFSYILFNLLDLKAIVSFRNFPTLKDIEKNIGEVDAIVPRKYNRFVVG